jgi:hypothetical protein
VRKNTPLKWDVDQLVELFLGLLRDHSNVAMAGIVDGVVEGIALPGLFQGYESVQ